MNDNKQTTKSPGGNSRPFVLGDFARDKITGFVGLLYGRTQFLHGITRWGLIHWTNVSRAIGGMGTRSSNAVEWIDEDRLEPLSTELAEVVERNKRMAITEQREKTEQKLQEVYDRAGADE